MAFETTRQEILKQAIELKKLYDTTRIQKYKDEELRLRRIVAELETIVLGSSVSQITAGTNVTISPVGGTGNVTINAVGDMTKAVYDSDNDGTVDAAETTQIIVRNSTGSTLTKGQVVYLSGATGNRPNALLSQANTEATSSKTIGIVVANIANNSDGYVAVSGTLHDLDTSAFADGAAVWLSATTAGAYTSTIPAEPNHTVFIGYIARSHPTQGRLVILIQNGYELNELHGVLISAEANNDLLVYESSSTLWKNKTISAIFGGTPLVSVPTLAQVTTAGNTTTNAITVGGVTSSGNIAVSANNTYEIGSSSMRWANAYLTTTYTATLRNISPSNALLFAGNNGTQLGALFNTGNWVLQTGGTFTDAGYKLDVIGNGRFYGATEDAAGTATLRVMTANTDLGFGGNTTYSWMQSFSSKPLYINQLGNNVILNLGGGSVGIGVSSPQTKVHIGPLTGGNGTAQERLRLSGDWSTTGSGALLRFTNQHDSGTNPNAGEYNLAGIAGVDDNGSWGGALYFYTSPQGTAGGANLNTRMVISSQGNVGIGTTSPTYKVDVQGTTLATSSVRVQGSFDINPLAAPPAIGGFTLSAGTNLGVGVYYYFVTYVTALGETNASSILTVTTTTGNTTVNLTGIPVSSDPRVTARKIYRTTVGQSSDGQKFLATISDNVTTTYTDSATDASLTGVALQYYKVNTTTRYITVSGVQGMVIDQNLTALGRNAGNAIISSNGASVRTVLVGADAGKSITTGQANVIVGVAGSSVSTGGNNTLVGDLVGWALNTGYGNTIVGAQAGRFLNSGYRNTFIGEGAGSYLADGTTQVTTAFTNTAIGRNTRLSTINDSNSIIIGDTALGLGSNTTVIGNSSTTFTSIPAGNMTIGGTTNAGYKLDVQGTVRTTGLITATGGINSGILNYGISSIPANTTFVNDTTRLFQTPAAWIWHDLFAFNRLNGSYETYNGTTWSASTLNLELFTQKQSQSIPIIDNVTVMGARWTFSSAAAGWSLGEWLVLGITWAASQATVSILFESWNGTAWVTRHTSSTSVAATNYFAYVSTFNGEYPLRLTILRTGGGTSFNLSNIQLLTSRPGDQGGGKEDSVPFYWNGNRNIGIGANAQNTSKLYVAGPIYATANNDTLVGVDVNPTFSSGSFTGIIQMAARFANRVHISNNNILSIGGNTVSNDTAYGNGFITSFNQSFTINGSGGTPYFRLYHTTGNLVLQNGGTFVDAGYRLDVNGTTRFTGDSYIAAGDFLLDNNRPIRWKDSGGTSRRAMLITAANDFQFGPVDTGWAGTTYVKAGGALQLIVNGASGTFATALTINTSSNVGIGTTSPNSKLDVVGSFSLLGSSGGYWLKGLQGNSAVNGNDPFLALVNNNSIASATFGWLFYDSGVDGSFNLYRRNNSTTGNQVYTISRSTGNFLINTTTDAGFKLDVNGVVRMQNSASNAVTTGLRLVNSAAASVTAGQGVQLDFANDNGFATSLSSSTIRSITTNTANGGADLLFLNYSGSALTEYMRITRLGNVGIGTTTPGDKLSIVDASNANIFGRITANGTNASAAWVAQNDQTDNVVYRVFGSAVTGSQMGISLARSASLMANLNGTGSFLIGTYSGTDLILGTANNENMRISNNTGNVLIGTTTDLGNMLEVAGVINSLAYSINNVPGYTGTLNIPGNPPGQQNIDIQSGIITNIF